MIADVFRQRGPELQRWLLGYIDYAFAGVRLDGGMTIYAGEAADRYGDAEEERLDALAERCDWRRVPPADLHDRHCALTYLDAIGLRFYTPAVMSTVLRGEDTRGLLTDAFCGELNDIRTTSRVRDVPYCRLYNRSQRAAILRFVKCLIFNTSGGWSNDPALWKTLKGLPCCCDRSDGG